MEVYVLKDGREQGPFRTFEIKELLRSGEIEGDDYGWIVGQSEWLPLRRITALGWIVSEFEPEAELDAEAGLDLDADADADADFTAEKVGDGAAGGRAWHDRTTAGDPDVPGLPGRPSDTAAPDAEGAPAADHRSGAEPVPAAHPFVRYAARTVDHALLMAAVAGVATLAGAAKTSVFAVVFSVHFLVSWMLVETGMLVMWGTTPGKLLMRVRVARAEDGRHPTVGEAFKRSLYLLFFGMGLGLPLLREIAYVMAVLRLREFGSTIWDDRSALRVEHGAVDAKRFVLALAILLLCLSAVFELAEPPPEILEAFNALWNQMTGREGDAL